MLIAYSLVNLHFFLMGMGLGPAGAGPDTTFTGETGPAMAEAGATGGPACACSSYFGPFIKRNLRQLKISPGLVRMIFIISLKSGGSINAHTVQ